MATNPKQTKQPIQPAAPEADAPKKKREITPEQYQRKASVLAAKKFIRSHANPEAFTEELFSQVVAAALMIIGPGKAPREKKARGGGGILDKLRALFEANAVVDEIELFRATRMGRSEARKRFRQLIRDAAPEARMWIAFDEQTEEWKLEGTGEQAPAGWTGYTPL